MADGGVVNPALDDDDLMPAAMESDVYASKQTKPIVKPTPQPKETGCWATFTRGLRCKTTVVNFYLVFIRYIVLESCRLTAAFCYEIAPCINGSKRR